MDEEDAGRASDSPELESRPPTEDDLVRLCRALNDLKARYVVVGGFAIIQLGLPRPTGDIGLLIATDLENEARVFKALEVFPDRAVRELDPGDVAKYIVVRVADEVLVDLMHSAGGLDYAAVAGDVVERQVQGVSIPFASAERLWQMKVRTHREKDAPDLVFLRDYFRVHGASPPDDI